MTKQEKIQEAYGEHWEWVLCYVDSDGWCHARKSIRFDEIKKDIEIETNKDDSYWWRPKSLQGIGTNNGWIKIEGEDDLPNEINGLWEVIMNGEQKFIELLKDNKERLYKDFKRDGITHYIIKEKSPLPIF